VFHLFKVDDVRLRDLFEREDLFGGGDYLLHAAEGTSTEGFGDLVLGDIVRVAMCGDGAFALGVGAVGLDLERGADLLAFALLLQFL
jgi:hypothetical protein